jgi:hypothetical protein
MRARITDEEYRCLEDAAKKVLGRCPTKAEGRSDSKANTQRQDWRRIRGQTEYMLKKKYDRPATKEEIYQLVRRYAKSSKGKPEEAKPLH